MTEGQQPEGAAGETPLITLEAFQNVHTSTKQFLPVESHQYNNIKDHSFSAASKDQLFSYKSYYSYDKFHTGGAVKRSR